MSSAGASLDSKATPRTARARVARALALSLGCALLLGVAAFWPQRTRSQVARPVLRAPIVFDALVGPAPPRVEAGARAEAATPPPAR